MKVGFMVKKKFSSRFGSKRPFVTFLVIFLSWSLNVALGSAAGEEYGVRWKESFRNTLGVDLDTIHHRMALFEKEATSKLQSKDATRNIALSSITILYREDGKGKALTYDFPKGCIFVSGSKTVEIAETSSSFRFLPPTDQDDLVRSITSRVKAVGLLNTGERVFLSPSVLKDLDERLKCIAADQKIRTDYKELRQILARHKGLSFNQRNADAVPTKAQLDQELEKIGTTIKQLGAYEFDRREALGAVTQELEIIQKHLSELTNLKKHIDDINQALKGCADAEQHLLAYLTENLVELEGLPANADVDHIILHIHSRFDMCQFCSPSFWIELKRPDGFLQDLRKTYTQSGKEPIITILVSSREELKGAGRRASGKDQNEAEPIDLSQAPQFVYQKIQVVE